MSARVSIRVFASFVSTSALASLCTANVSTVDDSGGADFTDIQSAVAAASDGDTILVRSGAYASFLIDDKALNVYADAGASVTVAGTVQIANLARSKRVVLSGLSVTGGSTYPTSDTALAMNVNVGSVRVQHCTFVGGAGATGPTCTRCEDPYGSGGFGADLFFCTDVSFTACTFRGGHGAGADYGEPGASYERHGSQGGTGVHARVSAVALYDCDIAGGNAGACANIADKGGDGYHAPTGGFFASGTAFRGGEGGYAWDFLGPAPGAGGDGVRAGASSNIHLLDDTYVAGEGGSGAFGPGPDGEEIDAVGILEFLSGAHRTCTAQAIATAGSSLAVTITGLPGDEVFLPWSNQTGFTYRSALRGTWLIRYPVLMTRDPIGVIPASGTLVVQIPLPPLPKGIEAAVTHVQGLVVGSGVYAYVASPMHVLRR